MFVYWIVGAFFDDLETLTLAVGIIRSFESVGSCLAFGIGAAQVAPMVNLVIAFVMFGITIPTTSYVVFLVPERPVDSRKIDHDDDGASSSSLDAADSTAVGKVADAIDGPRA